MAVLIINDAEKARIAEIVNYAHQHRYSREQLEAAIAGKTTPRFDGGTALIERARRSLAGVEIAWPQANGDRALGKRKRPRRRELFAKFFSR